MSRRRYRWSTETQTMEEVGADWADAERRAQTPTEELTYGGLRATDGTPIDSRRKHREYLKTNGLAMESDFTETRAKVQQERQSRIRERADIRETVARALYQQSTQRKRR